MLVSIITVCFNSEKTVSRTIQSVLNQTYDKIEYFIIDGQSSDRTVEIAESFRQEFLDRGYAYTVISEKDDGIYDAMNKGIRLSTGEIIGIINSDDWYEAQAVQRMIEMYRKNPFDMFYADLNMWSDVDGSTTLKMVKRSALRSPVVSRDWNHPTTFIKKATYNELGVYKCESLHDDWDFVLRVRKASKNVVVLNEVLANFTMNGVSHDKNIHHSINRGKARYKIYRDNGYSKWYWFECVVIEISKILFC